MEQPRRTWTMAARKSSDESHTPIIRNAQELLDGHRVGIGKHHDDAWLIGQIRGILDCVYCNLINGKDCRPETHCRLALDLLTDADDTARDHRSC